MADEDRLQVGRRPQVQSSWRLGGRRVPGPQNPAAQDAVLQLGSPWARERRHVDAHPDEQRHKPAHGAIGLPSGSGAGLPGRQDGLGELLRQAGAGFGAGGVNRRASQTHAGTAHFCPQSGPANTAERGPHYLNNLDCAKTSPGPISTVSEFFLTGYVPS